MGNWCCWSKEGGAAMKIVRKIIAVVVVIAGMLRAVSGMVIVMIEFAYGLPVEWSDMLSYGGLPLITGAGIMLLGILIWQLGEFNGKKLAGNFCTLIGIACILAVIANFLYSILTASPLFMGEEHIFLITILCGVAGIMIGKRLSTAAASSAAT
jgi:hypothetical protein